MPKNNRHRRSDPESKRVLAGVLGILLGWLGLHRFVLGDPLGGILRIALTIVTLGAANVLWLIEGIVYLARSDEEFVEVYQVGGRAWF